MVIALTIAVALATASAVLCAADQATSLLSRQRVHRLADTGLRGARRLERLQEGRSGLSGASALAGAAASAAGGWAGRALVLAAAGAQPAQTVLVPLGVAAGIGVAFSAGVLLPRTIAVQNPERVGLAAAPVASVLAVVFVPLVRVLAWPWTALIGLIGGPRASLPAWVGEDESRVAGDDEEDSARAESEEAFIDAVSEFTTKVVREVMVPRTDMVCLPYSATQQEAVTLIGEAGYSRLPVYRETLDDIRGVLYAKDLLLRIAAGDDVAPAAIARPALFVPESKSVEKLLVEMRRRAHIALVADEYGGTAGLVTIEDLIEEIVGEIFDEYDEVETLVEDAGEGVYLVDARLPVDDLNEMFGTAVHTEVDTVGGLVAELAGRIPAVGDAVETEGVRFVVESLEGTRIIRLMVGPAPGSGAKEER